MKKSFAKLPKLEMKPVFQFSVNDNKKFRPTVITDPITVTSVTITKAFDGSGAR